MAVSRNIDTTPNFEDDGSDIYLGVPSTYKAERPSGTVTSHGDQGGKSKDRYGFSTITPDPNKMVAPRYKRGDENKPATWSPEHIAEYQDHLVGAGLLTGKFRRGVWDDGTKNAWKKVLEYANRAGLDSRSALVELMTAPIEDESPDRAPFRAELPNPQDVEAVIDATAPDVLGHTLSAAEKQALIAAYNSVLTGAQRSAYDTAETGGTVTAAPTLETFITNEAKRLHPGDEHTRRLADAAKAFQAVVNAGGVQTEQF